MRSTLKCDIIVLLNIGFGFMKTKIIYISGNEIFDMNDIRSAFDEVRNALNLDKNTVLFGVPVDEDDAGLSQNTSKQIESDTPFVEPIDMSDINLSEQDVIQNEYSDEIEVSNDVPEQTKTNEVEPGPIVEKSTKKRSSKRKNTVIEEDSKSEDAQDLKQTSDDTNEKIVPILSVLSVKDEEPVAAESDEFQDTQDDDIEIIEDVKQETVIQETETPEIIDEEEIKEESEEEPDLEKLLSEMKPLEEDILDEPVVSESTDKTEEEDNIDATLEQLATEFVQTQDKISSSKSSSRSRIGKLRNILPFKQSKHADQGLGDLFGWAGVAANDEDFSVPGFFTNASSKK